MTLRFVTTLALGMFTISARADITFSTGNDPQANQANLLFNGTTDVTGMSSSTSTLVGHLNTTLAPQVTVTSDNPIQAPSIGQSTVQADSGDMDFLEFQMGNPPNGGAFTSIIFDLDADKLKNITVLPSGVTANAEYVTIHATEGADATCTPGPCTASQTFLLSADGSNFFTTLDVLGQNLTEVDITTEAGVCTDTSNLSTCNPLQSPDAVLTDVKQIRLGGTGIGTPLPEPTAIILMGTLLGAMVLFRRKLV